MQAVSEFLEGVDEAAGALGGGFGDVDAEPFGEGDRVVVRRQAGAEFDRGGVCCAVFNMVRETGRGGVGLNDGVLKVDETGMFWAGVGRGRGQEAMRAATSAGVVVVMVVSFRSAQGVTGVWQGPRSAGSGEGGAGQLGAEHRGGGDVGGDAEGSWSSWPRPT